MTTPNEHPIEALVRVFDHMTQAHASAMEHNGALFAAQKAKIVELEQDLDDALARGNMAGNEVVELGRDLTIEKAKASQRRVDLEKAQTALAELQEAYDQIEGGVVNPRDEFPISDDPNVKVDLASGIKTLITKFGKATSEWAWKGSQPPEAHDDILQNFHTSRYNLEMGITRKIAEAYARGYADGRES